MNARGVESGTLTNAADDLILLRSVARHQLDEAIGRLTEICMNDLSWIREDSSAHVRRCVQMRRAALREVATLFARDWQDLDDLADTLLVITSPGTRTTLECVMTESEYREWLLGTLRQILTPT